VTQPCEIASKRLNECGLTDTWGARNTDADGFARIWQQFCQQTLRLILMIFTNQNLPIFI
jgi:hypothetical protein